jgi:ABC-type nickel/cobalt efflux system permease component RcnA
MVKLFRKKLDWVDIILHVLGAMVWGILVGFLFGNGTITQPVALILAIAGALFWLVRELYQHDWGFGGIQSQLEWIAPVAATPLAFYIGTSF